MAVLPSELAAQPRTAGGAWAIEAAGGSVGSLVGFGVGALMVRGDCEAEDLECYLDSVGLVLLTASASSTLGTWIVGQATGTEPSLAGSALGSLVGAVAGLGVIKALDEIGSSADEGGGAVIAFSVTQGVVNALGSRIGAALR